MKKIGIIVTASVAIIKIKKLKDMLLSKGHEVIVIPTEKAFKYFRDIESLNPIKINEDLLEEVDHISIVKKIDLFIVAPASANTISKFVNGICDNIALTALLATNKKIIFAPAMNNLMYEAILKRNHIETLENWGHYLIGPNVGFLREGDFAIGRMAEPEEIVELVTNIFQTKNQKRKIIVSYGASKIYLDPIRFISNDSSGLFGRLIIKELKMLGLEVESLNASHFSNEEILEKVKNYDIYISSAALSDFKVDKALSKIKKNSISQIQLKNNIDVLSELKKTKPEIKILGFKLDEKIENALLKKAKLNLDGILYNEINSMKKSKITGSLIIGNRTIDFQNKAKYEIAKIIAKEIELWTYM